MSTILTKKWHKINDPLLILHYRLSQSISYNYNFNISHSTKLINTSLKLIVPYLIWLLLMEVLCSIFKYYCTSVGAKFINFRHSIIRRVNKIFPTSRYYMDVVRFGTWYLHILTFRLPNKSDLFDSMACTACSRWPSSPPQSNLNIILWQASAHTRPDFKPCTNSSLQFP